MLNSGEVLCNRLLRGIFWWCSSVWVVLCNCVRNLLMVCFGVVWMCSGRVLVKCLIICLVVWLVWFNIGMLRIMLLFWWICVRYSVMVVERNRKGDLL